MYNDDNSLKSILKESYGGKMSECKKKKKPFSKLLAKVRESGNKYKDGGSAWDKVGDFFSGEGAKKTIRRTTGQEEPVEHESFDESLHPQLRKAMEFRKKKKRMGDF